MPLSHDPHQYGYRDAAPPLRSRRIFFFAAAICGVLLIAAIGLLHVMQAPSVFPVNERIEIPFGTTLADASRIMEEAGAVRSSLALQLILLGHWSEQGVRAGVYQFEEPLNALGIAEAITSGTHGVPLVRITIPEGLRDAQIDAIITERLPGISAGAFLAASEGEEGYLFPETYHVPETFTAAEFVALMKETFAERIETAQADIDASGRTLPQIITMASILEREANSEETMRMVADILWKRLDEDMLLQVDASFAYLLGKKSEEVTLDDFAIDSPYNTYKYRGLPPTPISNPGMQAILAALHPTPSPYYYYLTASDGSFHYAATFAEHEKNIAKYLGGME